MSIGSLIEPLVWLLWFYLIFNIAAVVIVTIGVLVMLVVDKFRER